MLAATAFSLIVPTFPEGLAVGMGFGSDRLGQATAFMIAVALQNIPEGLTVSLPYTHSRGFKLEGNWGLMIGFVVAMFLDNVFWISNHASTSDRAGSKLQVEWNDFHNRGKIHVGLGVGAMFRIVVQPELNDQQRQRPGPTSNQAWPMGVEIPRQRTARFSCLVLFATLMLLAACASPLPYEAVGRVVHAYPHAPEAFTQGLVFDGATLYESTGLYGESSLRRVDLETGEVLQIQRLSEQYFAEGCTVWNDQIIQLTWKAGKGFVYDRETFDLQREFDYAGEGWGLTHDGRRLIMSDGTSYLRFLDPETFEEMDRIQVVDKGEPVTRLNELEWVRGQVWANVWQTPRVARIDAKTGEVLGWIDFSGLTEEQPRGVLNGIATKGQRIFVTGKRWDALYQVEIEPARSN